MKNLGARLGRVYVHPATIEFYAKKTWDFAKAILWNNDYFNPSEVELIIDHIGQYYKSLKPLRFKKLVGNYFESFCERILAIQHFVISHKNCKLKHPCIWFNPVNPNGFNRDFSWVKKNWAQKKIQTKKSKVATIRLTR